MESERQELEQRMDRMDTDRQTLEGKISALEGQVAELRAQLSLAGAGDAGAEDATEPAKNISAAEDDKPPDDDDAVREQRRVLPCLV
jgi:phage shock protein A